MSVNIFGKLTICLSCITSIFATPSYEDRHNINNKPFTLKDEVNYRLPATTVPLNYKINLDINPEAESFSGDVTIEIVALFETDEIVLHAHPNIIINNYTVQNSTHNNISNYYEMSEDDTHFLRIELNTALTVDEIYKITIEYTGKYGYLKGVYRSSYKDEKNNTRYLVNTQFQAVSAREAFPCYDEPHLKATFDLTINHPDKYHAISNGKKRTSVRSRKDRANLKTTFMTTPKMSTYLVAFVVSDFDMRSNNRHEIMPIPFQVFAIPHAKDSLYYPLEFAQSSLLDLETWIGYSYNMEKMDKIAIPNFAAGAMENWGLVTYREEYLLHTPGVTSAWEEQQISAVISHENSHMWFGNEVTPLWWDYLWLSEGFATYFEYYTTDRVSDNKYRMMDQYVARYMQGVMYSDALNSTNPMTNNVNSPEEIDNNFNGIAYDKSGGVIRMIQHVLGETNFQKGLQNYIKTLNGSVTEPIKLFEELDKVADLPSGITIQAIFESWSTQKGFPVVTAKRYRTNNTIDLSQSHFSSDSLQTDAEWIIPISLTTLYDLAFENTKPIDYLIPNANLSITIEVNEHWFIVNLQQSGYYRVMYDDANWNKLIVAIKTIEHQGIHYLNRAQLIDDSSAFTAALEMPVDMHMDLLNYLENELDFIPWISAERAFNKLHVVMAASPEYYRFMKFTSNMVKKSYNKLGFSAKSTDSPVDKIHRAIAMGIECKSGSRDIRHMASEEIAKTILVPSYPIDPDLRSTIYCCGLRQADRLYWDYIIEKYFVTEKSSEKFMILKSLGCTENEDIATRYLNMSISPDSGIRDIDRYRIVVAVINSGTIGVNFALEFITNRFATMQECMKEGTLEVIKALQENIGSGNQVAKFHVFREKYYNKFTPNELRGIDIATEVINRRSAWGWESLNTIDKWLIKNVVINNSNFIKISKYTIVICAIFVIHFRYVFEYIHIKLM